MTDDENVAAAASPDSPLDFPLKNLIQNWLGDNNASQIKTELPFPTSIPRSLSCHSRARQFEGNTYLYDYKVHMLLTYSL